MPADDYGYDPGASRARAMLEKLRAAEASGDEQGGLKPLVAAAKVPKVSRIRKRLNRV
jgi:hypothetical protein